MSQSRKAIASFVAHKSVDVVFDAVDAGEDLNRKNTVATVDESLDEMLAEISNLEKAEEISKAQEMFAGLSEVDALASKRRMARRASEANSVAAWIVASIAGASAGTCEQYRKASNMRLSPVEIEADLAELVKSCNLQAIPCATKTEGGKFVKAKATPAPVMALVKLQHARQALRAYNIATETAKSAQAQAKTALATLSALQATNSKVA